MSSPVAKKNKQLSSMSDVHQSNRESPRGMGSSILFPEQQLLGLQGKAGNQAVHRLLDVDCVPPLEIARLISVRQQSLKMAPDNPNIQHAQWSKVENSVTFILHKLDKTFISNEDEQQVIDELTYWATEPNPLESKKRSGSRYLEHIFHRLTNTTKDVGIVSDQVSSYYSYLFNHFDRVDEVRNIRDTYAPTFKGDNGLAETSWRGMFWEDVKKGIIEQQIYGYFQGLGEAAVGFAESIVIMLRATTGDPNAVRTLITGFVQLPSVVIQFWEHRQDLANQFLSASPHEQARLIGRIIGEVEIFLLTRKAGKVPPNAVAGEQLTAEVFQISNRGAALLSPALDISKLGPALQKSAMMVAHTAQASGAGNKGRAKLKDAVKSKAVETAQRTPQTQKTTQNWSIENAKTEWEKIKQERVNKTTKTTKIKPSSVEPPKTPDDAFGELRDQLGNEPVSTKPRTGGVKQAFKDSESFVKGNQPGQINTEVHQHKHASDFRETINVTGKDFQSAHGSPSSWLNKNIWRNGKIININYSRADAVTRLLPPEIHKSFDGSWKNFAITRRQVGVTKVPVGEMLRVMREAVTRSSIAKAEQGSLITIIESEVRGLGLLGTDIIELPYPNVEPM